MALSDLLGTVPNVFMLLSLMQLCEVDAPFFPDLPRRKLEFVPVSPRQRKLHDICRYKSSLVVGNAFCVGVHCVLVPPLPLPLLSEGRSLLSHGLLCSSCVSEHTQALEC